MGTLDNSGRLHGPLLGSVAEVARLRNSVPAVSSKILASNPHRNGPIEGPRWSYTNAESSEQLLPRASSRAQPWSIEARWAGANSRLEAQLTKNDSALGASERRITFVTLLSRLSLGPRRRRRGSSDGLARGVCAAPQTKCSGDGDFVLSHGDPVLDSRPCRWGGS